jgi:hypothetical protein
MLVSCLLLLILRAVAIGYGVYFPPPRTQDLLVWQQAKPIDPNRTDLLSTPTLYYFCDQKDILGTVLTQLFENSLFNNRDLVNFIRNNFIPVKVERRTDAPQEPFDELFQKLSYEICPSLVVALPNGTRVHYTSWQSDRMLLAVLRDGLEECPLAAAQYGMKKGKFDLACQGFAKYYAKKMDLPWARFDDRLSKAIHWYFALRHEKRDKEANELVNKMLKDWHKNFRDDTSWPVPCLRYLIGQIPADDVVKLAGKGKSELTTAHYAIGVQSELNGDVKNAKDHLHLAIFRRPESDRDDYNYARTELRLMGETLPKTEDD